jgi:hypothetical protein
VIKFFSVKLRALGVSVVNFLCAFCDFCGQHFLSIFRHFDLSRQKYCIHSRKLRRREILLAAFQKRFDLIEAGLDRFHTRRE